MSMMLVTRSASATLLDVSKTPATYRAQKSRPFLQSAISIKQPSNGTPRSFAMKVAVCHRAKAMTIAKPYN